MRQLAQFMCAASVFVFFATASQAASPDKVVAQGKAIFMSKSRGNCISCHQINDPDAKLAGHQGPPMVAMQQRFPDKRQLRSQIWDATRNNPITIMPPLGKHWILSEEEIDAVVEYIYQF